MVCLKNSLLTSPQLLYNTNRKRWEHLWKRTVANMEHELPLKHAIAPCSFNTSFLAGNLGLGVCNFPFFCVLRTLAAVHISTASLEEYHLFFTTKTGVSILPTQTRTITGGNPSKLPCICTLSWLIPPKWVIQWPLKNPESEAQQIKDWQRRPVQCCISTLENVHGAGGYTHHKHKGQNQIE